MAEDKMQELLLALQNRLNDAEIKLAKWEKGLSAQSETWAASFEERISKLRAEIADLLKKKADASPPPAQLPQKKHWSDWFFT